VTESIYEKYLINGEKVANVHTVCDNKIHLAITNKRLIVVDGGETNFYDIKFGSIVSVGLEYESDKSYLYIFLITVGAAIFSRQNIFAIANEEILNISMAAFAVVALFSLVGYLLSRKSKLFITTKDSEKHEYILKGADAKDKAVNICLDIRNADERYYNLSE